MFRAEAPGPAIETRRRNPCWSCCGRMEEVALLASASDSSFRQCVSRNAVCYLRRPPPARIQNGICDVPSNSKYSSCVMGKFPLLPVARSRHPVCTASPDFAPPGAPPIPSISADRSSPAPTFKMPWSHLASGEVPIRLKRSAASEPAFPPAGVQTLPNDGQTWRVLCGHSKRFPGLPETAFWLQPCAQKIPQTPAPHVRRIVAGPLFENSLVPPPPRSSPVFHHGQRHIDVGVQMRIEAGSRDLGEVSAGMTAAFSGNRPASIVGRSAGARGFIARWPSVKFLAGKANRHGPIAATG